MADYATVIMAYLAKLEQHATAREIAEATHIAWPTVCKILKLLVKNNLLTSARGVSGGYELASTPEMITLEQILNAMDDNIAMTECASDNSACSRQAHCHVSGHWRAISGVIQTALAGFTLADMLAPSAMIAVQAAKIGLLNTNESER